jgi:hypothetical protein
VLPWLLVAAVVLLPVILRIFAEGDDPGSGLVHHSGGDEPEQDDPGDVLAAA